MLLESTVLRVAPVDRSLEKDAKHKIDYKTKPLGSLGQLENVAVRMSMIQNNLNPKIGRKGLAVFAGDHGIVAEGVSAYPAEVTPQMVLNFLAGGAAINVLCRHEDIDMAIVDVGVNYDFNNTPGLINKKVNKGTRNFLRGLAMTRQEAVLALEKGIEVFNEKHKNDPLTLSAVGEMGIGNTTSATAILCAVTGVSVSEATGRGTGLDDSRLAAKQAIIQKALDFHAPSKTDAIDILSKVGGYEIAGMAGFILASAAEGVPVVLDGLISTAAGVVAALIAPAVKDYLFSGHRSVEIGQKAGLDFLGITPLVYLDMRVGEGTGAALATNMITAACKIMCDMSSFDDAGVSNKD